MPNASIQAAAEGMPKKTSGSLQNKKCEVAKRSIRATAIKVKEQQNRTASIADLSFVVDQGRRDHERYPRDFWAVKSTGDYSKDCDTGRRLALEYLKYEECNPGGGGSLQLIVDHMPRLLTGLEVGFLSMVGIAAGRGAWKAFQVSNHWDACSAREVQS